MASVIIPASKSLTVTNKFPDANINDDIILVGCDGVYDYISYIFFDISSIPCNVLISNAELILFKTNNFYNDFNKFFLIRTLKSYFSSYTTYNNRPETSLMLEKKIYPLTSEVVVRINVTAFVSMWLRNGLSSTSLELRKKNSHTIVNFGSAISKDSSVIPFIKVSFDSSHSSDSQIISYQNIKQPSSSLRQVRVIGTVAGSSIYESAVNIEIARKDSGNIDNYYVADEYYNPSMDPMNVDKTYNIAIIPSEQPGDMEKISHYGSYKNNSY